MRENPKSNIITIICNKCSHIWFSIGILILYVVVVSVWSVMIVDLKKSGVELFVCGRAVALLGSSPLV